MVQSPEYPDLKWMSPRSFSRGRPNHDCSTTGRYYKGGARLITVHYTAGSEGYTNAEGGASYDQRRTDGTSAHYYVDADSVVQCIKTSDRSHTALQHGNLWGIHYELCGTAQTRTQWLDKISRATIRKAARQMARDMKKYNIPLKRVTSSSMKTVDAKGICGHADWTYGWPSDGGTHTDPGKAFPWDVLFDDIREFLGENDMTPEELLKIKLPLSDYQRSLFPDDKAMQDGITLESALEFAVYGRKAFEVLRDGKVVDKLDAILAKLEGQG